MRDIIRDCFGLIIYIVIIAVLWITGTELLQAALERVI